MADEIKIRVGVQSNVKAGMGNIIRDIRSQGEDMGRGFGSAFRQAASGNISGALNALFGGAVAGAALTGWQIGKKIDETFGISDKVANWWSEAAIKAGRSWDAFYKGLRANRIALDKEMKDLNDRDSTVFNIRESARTKNMTLQEKLDYAGQGMDMAGASLAGKLTPTERIARTATYEKLKAEYNELLSQKKAMDDKDYSEKWQKESDLASGKIAFDEKVKAAQIASDKEKAEQEAKSLETYLQKRTELRDLEIDYARTAAKSAADIAESLSTPAGRNAARNAEKEAERNRNRQAKIDAEMEGRIGRGVTGRSIDDWLDMKASQRKADAKQQELDELTKQQAADIKRLADKATELWQMK